MATITIYPRTDTVSKKSGKIPMYVRVLHLNKKAEASLKLEISKVQLQQWDEKSQSFLPSSNPLNHRINQIKADSYAFVARNKVKLYPFTAKDILSEIIGNAVKCEECKGALLLKDYIGQFLSENIEGSSKIKEGTKRNYRKSTTHFLNYLKSCDLEKIELKEFNYHRASQFDIYLSNIYYENKKTKMLPVSVSSIVIKVKAMFEHAMKSDLIIKNPFKGVKIITESIEKRPQLSAEELAKIYHCDLSSYPTLEVYRDMFLFSCYTGLAYGDMINLKWSNISLVMDGVKLKTQRLKTNLPVEQYLLSYTVEILKRCKADIAASINGAVFPPRSLTQLNINIKRLADICGIAKKISSHIGRHTCSGLLDQAGIPDDIVTSRIMGWTTGKKTSWTYKCVSDSALQNRSKTFQLYLDKYLKDGNTKQ